MTPRQIALGADVFTGLMVVSVAAALGSLIWHGAMPPREPRAIVTHRRAPAATEVDIAPIVALAPFGTAAAASEAGGELVLRGILLANPATLSTALIADGAGHVLGYRLGQTLPNGATLAAIARDQVTLQGGSGLVRLGFARPGTASGTDPADPDFVATPDARAAATAAAQGGDQTVVIGKDPDLPSHSPPPAVSAPPAAPPPSGAAAIRALIPPAVAGMGAAPSDEPDRQSPR